MKGSQKRFARQLDSEYYDDYLEAPDGYDQHDYNDQYGDLLDQGAKTNNQKPPAINKAKAPEQEKKPAAKKHRQPEGKSNLTLERTPLTNGHIRKFVSLLGQDAKNCYYKLREVQAVEEPDLLQAYDQIYQKFETIPVYFLSVVPKEAVYLWQVNRLCPYQKNSDFMVLDSRALTSEVKAHVSMLLLAKIGPAKGEEVLDAKFLGAGRVLVKSQRGKDELVMRLYKTKSFGSIARLNPFKPGNLGNDQHSLELSIKFITKADGSSSIETSLWEHKTAEELSRSIDIQAKPPSKEEGEDTEEERTIFEA